MTSEKEIIEIKTGHKMGSVILRGLEGEDKIYDVCESGNNVYDENEGNFHLFPIMCPNNNTENNLWKKYFSITQNERRNILQLLQDEGRWEKNGLVVNLEQKATLQSVRGETKADTVYLLYRAGGSGYVRNFPYGKELNHFFRNLYVYFNGRFHCVNFMRFYIEKTNDKDKIINCIYGEFQFDTTADKNRRVNEDEKICYPLSKYKQSYSQIELRLPYQACVYNPNVNNVVELENNEDALADEFIKFIREVNKRAKK